MIPPLGVISDAVEVIGVIGIAAMVCLAVGVAGQFAVRSNRRWKIVFGVALYLGVALLIVASVWGAVIKHTTGSKVH